MDDPRDTEIPIVFWIADVCIPRDHSLAVLDRGATVVDRCSADTIGGPTGDIVQRVRSVENREWSAGLQSNDAAQLKISPRPIIRSKGSEVHYQPVASVLIGVRSLRGIVELVGGEVDKRSEVAIVNRMRIGIVRGQIEILSSFKHRERTAVVNGIGDIIVIVVQSIAQRLQA